MRRFLAAGALGASLLCVCSALPASAASKPTTITLQTKTHGAGPHPVLRWKPVEGATRYILSVNTTKGAPYWSWTGNTTKIRFGGGADSSSNPAGGATLTHKMRWFVIAFDDTGTVLGTSKPRPIAP